MEFDSIIFVSVIFALWVVYFWESYLHLRQHNVVQSCLTYPASKLWRIMTAESFRKARAYSLDKSFFEFWSGIVNQLITTAVLLFSGLPLAWNASVYISAYLSFKSEYMHSVVFILLTSIFNLFVSMPLTIYSTFVIEQKHGFNKQTPSFFAKDQLKKFLVGQAIMVPVTILLLYIIDVGGKMFFFWAWFFIFCVTIAMVFIYHDFIAPLFDKYIPLPDGDLRSAIEQLCESHTFPLCKLLVVEGSKRSAHSNAYFYGFWKNKKIVLFDTLLSTPVFPKEEDKSEKQEDATSDKVETNEPEAKEDSDKPKGCSTPEILAVLAHELGHWSLWHNFKNLVLMQINLLTSFALFGFLIEYNYLFSGFGFSFNENGVYPTIIRLAIVFQFILLPYHEVIGFLMTCLCRRFEFEADRYAVSDGRGKELADALVKLNQDNLGFPLCDWLYSLWNYSHPPILERLGEIEQSSEKKTQ